MTAACCNTSLGQFFFFFDYLTKETRDFFSRVPNNEMMFDETRKSHIKRPCMPLILHIKFSLL